MLDLLVIVAGFAAGVLAIVAINGARRGGSLPLAQAKARKAPPPAPGYPQPAYGGAPPAYGVPQPSPTPDDHGIRVNHPGVAVAAAPAPPAPAPAAPPPPAAPTPPPGDDDATAMAAGPSLAKASPSGPSGGSAARLELEDGSASVALGEEPVTMGRGSDQALRIRDTKASRAHAVVRRRSKGRDGWEVADSGSANGTSLNGHTIPEGRVAPLRDGDRIGIGDVTVVYVEDGGPSEDPAPPPRPAPDPDATQVQR